MGGGADGGKNHLQPFPKFDCVAVPCIPKDSQKTPCPCTPLNKLSADVLPLLLPNTLGKLACTALPIINTPVKSLQCCSPTPENTLDKTSRTCTPSESVCISPTPTVRSHFTPGNPSVRLPTPSFRPPQYCTLQTPSKTPCKCTPPRKRRTSDLFSLPLNQKKTRLHRFLLTSARSPDPRLRNNLQNPVHVSAPFSLSLEKKLGFLSRSLLFRKKFTKNDALPSLPTTSRPSSRYRRERGLSSHRGMVR